MRRRQIQWRLVLVAALLLAPCRAHAGLAFVGLQGLGVAPVERANLERLVTRVLEEIAGINLLSPQQVREQLTDPEYDRLAQCMGQTSCLVDFGGLTNSQLVLTGSVARFGEGATVILKLVDVLADAEKETVQQRVSGSEVELLDALRRLVVKLIHPERYRGSLSISGVPAGANVSVDGQPIDSAQLDKPIGGLFVGTHTVSVNLAGYRPFTAMAEVDVGATSTVAVSLVPLGVTTVGGGPGAGPAGYVTHDGGPGTGAVIGSIGLGVVAVALATVAGIGGVAGAAADDRADEQYLLLRTTWASTGRRLEPAEFTQAVRDRDNGYVLAMAAGSTAAACLIGAGLWLLLDWQPASVLPTVTSAGSGAALGLHVVLP